MNLGKRFYEIAKELSALDTKQVELIAELQPLVLRVLGSYRSHKTLDELFAKILKTRPNTKKAAVGAVLAGLASRGKVLRQDDSFYLPADPSGVPAPAPKPFAPTGPAVQETPRLGMAPEPLED